MNEARGQRSSNFHDALRLFNAQSMIVKEVDWGSIATACYEVDVVLSALLQVLLFP